jgi:hypothetical protein
LFAAGADPKIRIDFHGFGSGPFGSTLLHEAASAGNVESVRLLIEKGASLNARDGLGETPLDKAFIHWHTDVVELLLQHGAKRTLPDNFGTGPLFGAAEKMSFADTMVGEALVEWHHLLQVMQPKQRWPTPPPSSRPSDTIGFQFTLPTEWIH